MEKRVLENANGNRCILYSFADAESPSGEDAERDSDSSGADRDRPENAPDDEVA